jgi:hypothetical protein
MIYKAVYANPQNPVDVVIEYVSNSSEAKARCPYGRELVSLTHAEKPAYAYDYESTMSDFWKN